MTTAESLRTDLLIEARRAHDAYIAVSASIEAERTAYLQASAACKAYGVPEDQIPGYQPKAPRSPKGERESKIVEALSTGALTSKEIIALFGSDRKVQTSARSTMYALEKARKIAKTADGKFVLSTSPDAKKKPGRKPKAANAEGAAPAVRLKKDGTPAMKRGRKPKAEATPVDPSAPVVEKKKPGRPRKVVAAATPVEAPVAAPAEAVAETVNF